MIYYHHECLNEPNDDSGEICVLLAINDGSLLEYILLVNFIK